MEVLGFLITKYNHILKIFKIQNPTWCTENTKIDSVWNRILSFSNAGDESEVKIEKLKVADSKCKKLIWNGSSSTIVFLL